MIAAAALLLTPPPAGQAPLADPPPASQVSLSAAELFVFADAARDAGDFAVAEKAYRALAGNPDIELRSEARFRLGMMLADLQQKYREAGVEFRKILDEKPGAARVRLELARMQALLGNLGAAEREFRAAEAAGLPPEVERTVRFYAGALSARKRWGGSVEVAMAPDSNINRATKSETLGTILGDFELSKDGLARSGVGLALRGQTFLRVPLRTSANLLARLSGSAELYRQMDVSDMVVGLQVGPEVASGADRISLSAGPAWRWYGTDPYSSTLAVNASWQHPTGKRSQLRLDLAAARVNNRRNDLQDAWYYSLSASLDRAFTARSGGGIQLHAAREAARDPGYSTAGGGASLYVFREMGRTTAVATLGYSHLEADQRLFLYLRRRVEDRFSAGLSATFRALKIGTFAPLARVKWERNRSSIELYDFNRLAGEIGITSAF